MKILVTGANGDIAEAIGRIVKEHVTIGTIDGADCSGTLPAECLFDHVHLLPRANAPEFLPAFRELALSYDCVIPVPEAELVVLASQSEKWRAPLPLLMNEPWVIRTFCDKLETYRWLTQCGDIAAQTKELTDVAPSELPIVAKPRFGWGSKGVQVVHSIEHLTWIQQEARGKWIAQAFLDADDQEYTCAIAKERDVVNTITMIRTLQGGLTKQARVVWDGGIQDLLLSIGARLPERAYINVQLRVFRGRPMVFEINPRFSSTAMMRHLVGFRDVVWALESFRGVAMQPATLPTGATIVRLSREVVIQQ